MRRISPPSRAPDGRSDRQPTQWASVRSDSGAAIRVCKSDRAPRVGAMLVEGKNCGTLSDPGGKVGSVLRREPRTIAWAALTVLLVLALPIAVVVGLDHRVPVHGIVIAAAILFVALLVVSTFALITRRRAPEGAPRSLESDSSDVQPSSRQRS
jgi:hypothetical protein